VALLWVPIDILNTHNRDHLNPSEPIDDRGLVHTHVARRDPADKLVIQLAEASTLEVPRQTTPARRRRKILLPEGIRPEHAPPIRSETRARLVAAIARGAVGLMSSLLIQQQVQTASPSGKTAARKRST